jgi:hypothetical protein
MTAGFADFVEQLIAELLGGTSPPELLPPPLQTAFPDSVVEPGYVLDAQADDLNAAIDDLVPARIDGRQPFKNLAFAVVDLSGGPTGPLPPPRFAGNLVQSHRQVDSLAKIAVMLAAHNLRSNVAARAASGQAANDVELALAYTQQLMTAPDPITRAAAKPTLVHDIVPDPSGQTDHTRTGGPDVRHVLDLASDGGWRVRFKSNAMTPQQLVEIGHEDRPAIARLPFAQRMWLMIRQSNNLAATTCLNDLGFPYIAAVSRQIGLLDIPAKRGLWLARDYDGFLWNPSDTPFAAFPIHPTQASTASAAAAFMTLLWQHRLLPDRDANTDMKELLRVRPPGRASHFQPVQRPGPNEPLDLRPPQGGPDTTFFSKIGIGEGGFSDVGVIVRRLSDSFVLRYVLAGLGAPSAADLRELAVAVDDRLLRLHTSTP